MIRALVSPALLTRNFIQEADYQRRLSDRVAAFSGEVPLDSPIRSMMWHGDWSREFFVPVQGWCDAFDSYVSREIDRAQFLAILNEEERLLQERALTKEST